MSPTKDYDCIPAECRDQHLFMVPEYAQVFKDHGVRSVGIHEVVKPYGIVRSPVSWHLALFTFSGSAKWDCHRETGVMQPGDIWVGPANLAHSYYAIDNWKFISVALFQVDQFSHLEGKPLQKKLINQVNHLRNNIEAYITESSLFSKQGGDFLAPLANYCSQFINRELQPSTDYKNNRILYDLQQMWEMVNASPNAKWSIPTLAQHISVSNRQFQRLMRLNYGMTAEQMLTKIRMEHARELLLDATSSMLQVSEKVGYSCVYSFSKAFKRFYGVSPRAYARQYSSDMVEPESVEEQ